MSVNAGTVKRRLWVLGELPEIGGGRGLFGRGLRDVWLRRARAGSKASATSERWSLPAEGRLRALVSQLVQLR